MEGVSILLYVQLQATYISVTVASPSRSQKGGGGGFIEGFQEACVAKTAMSCAT